MIWTSHVLREGVEPLRESDLLRGKPGEALGALSAEPAFARTLTQAQAKAVDRLAASPWTLNVLDAEAGAGFSKVIAALAEVFCSRGRKTRYLAVQRCSVADAAERGFVNVSTIRQEAGLIEQGAHGWRSGELVVAVEAHLLDEGQFYALVRAAQSVTAKLVLVGDGRQTMFAPLASDVFARLSDELPWTLRLDEEGREGRFMAC